jgi:hypothetical protein
MLFHCLFHGRCLETNASEPFSSNSCFSGSTVLALSKYATLLPPYGCLSRVAYRCATVPSIPTAMFVKSVIALTFLPVAHFSWWLFLSNCSLLRPHRVPVSPGLSPSSRYFNKWGQNFLEWPMLLHLQLLLCVQSLLSFQRGPTPPQSHDIHFPNPDWRFKYSLHDLQHESLPENSARCPLASQK